MAEIEKTHTEGGRSEWDELINGPTVPDDSFEKAVAELTGDSEGVKPESVGEDTTDDFAEKVKQASAKDSAKNNTEEPKEKSEVFDTQVKDADYYRQNPKEVSGMVARLIQMRGGVDGAEGIVWDDNLKARVDKNGLPVEWMRLTKFLRSNPDKLDIIVSEYNHLSGADTAVQSEKKPEEGDDIPEGEMRDDDVDEEATEGSEGGEETANAKPSAEIIDFVGDRTKAQIEEIDDRIGRVMNMQEQSEIWKKIEDALSTCSDDVKAEMTYLRADEGLKNSKEYLQEYKDRLRRMPVFALPWSKHGQAKAALRQMIETSERSVNYQEDQVAKLKEKLPKVLSDKDNETVLEFRRLDGRMARLNDDLHTRELIKDINVRKRWIADQERMMGSDQSGQTLNSPSDATRRDAIKKWRNEISTYQKRIQDYRALHPDFELYPGELRQKQILKDMEAQKAA